MRLFRITSFMLSTLVILLAGQANAQVVGGGFGNQVGGVKIDADGVLSKTEKLEANTLQELEAGLRQSVGADISTASDLRMVSLKGLEKVVREAQAANKPLPLDVQYMAGLQRIEYIMLSPEKNDIIIAGPGEGLRVDDTGVVVGKKSGTPAIRLEDFLVAMRTIENNAVDQSISVSIDPTEEGVKQLQALYSQLRRARTGFRPNMSSAVETAMGPQKVSLVGVPKDSRFSQVLLAADYKMKRIAMGLDKSPIENFPNFMEILQKSGVKSLGVSPRFWMECSYQPVAKDEAGMAWQIRGQGVKALTEDSVFDRQGKKDVRAGQQNRFAKKWADAMTKRFEELAVAAPSFRELRNLMDISVAAAIIRREGLANKVGLEMPALLGETVSTPSRNVPETLPAQCSFVRLSNSYLISTSGGVMLEPWAVAKQTEAADLSKVVEQAKSNDDASWWWNAVAAR